jgi:hypothetical protein
MTGRWHPALKNRVLLKTCFLPAVSKPGSPSYSEAVPSPEYHDSHDTLTFADAYPGRSRIILLQTRKDQANGHQTAALADQQDHRLK